MQNGSAPMVDATEIIRLVGSTFYQRGRDYARAGAVISTHWEPGPRVLTGSVQGTTSLPYRCTIVIGPEVKDLALPLASSCSCPIGADCKHVAALLLQSNADRVREHAPGAKAVRNDWRTALSPVDDSRRTGKLGLLFELRERGARAAGLGKTPSPSYRLGVRPLLQSRTGNWVRSEVTWNNVGHFGNRLDLDPAQQRWFAGLSALSRTKPFVYDHQDADWIVLDDFPSPLLWTLLHDAAALGIPLVGGKKGAEVTLLDEARLSLDVAGDKGGFSVTTALQLDGRQHPLTATGTIGDHGFYAWELGAGQRFWLAPLPTEQVRLLRQQPTTTVPSDEVDEFLREHYPRLSRSVEVRSVDAAVLLPDIVPPTLVLTVTFLPGQSLRWEHRWEGMRDEDAERGILDAIGRLLPSSPTLRDLDAAEFVAETLPRFRELDHVRVELIGEQPDYRELTEVPTLVMRTVATDQRDWFDLGVNVSIEGHVVPFVDLFRALSRGKPKLLLIDGSYLSLEQPVFDQLRRLIDEASSLAEWETRPRISRYQASLWSEFEDLADDTDQAKSWRAAVSGLLGEVEPTPAPASLTAELRPYQQQGLDWLAFLWRNSLGGILADDMGLGKTLQTLALIAHAKASGSSTPFLIVAPTSVVSTWLAEAARFAPTLVVRTVTTTEGKSGLPLAELARDADVVVTSYALFRIDSTVYQAIDWAGLVLDEAQFVKNPASKAHELAVALETPFKLAITGTPLENSLMDLWSLFSIVAPGLFASSRRFAEDYVRPIAAGDRPELLSRLRQRIRPLMLRRSKELVAPELPEKQEQLLQVELTPRHRRLYDTTLHRERQKLLGLIDDLDKNRFIVFRSLTLLRMLSLDASLVDEKHADIPSAKLDALLEQLGDVVALGHRALVFSQFTSFLRRAAASLERAGIAYEYLDGSTLRRREVIERFRSGDAPVFLISLKAGGFGLTLTEADYVFLLDPWWNPATEAQAVDRTHRIGQTRPVNVYRLVATGTIEEKVMALRDSKAKLFDAVMDEDAAFGSTLTAEDIRGLLDA
jgi:superfamily II DNA or RNA helicase